MLNLPCDVSLSHTQHKNVVSIWNLSVSTKPIRGALDWLLIFRALCTAEELQDERYADENARKARNHPQARHGWQLNPLQWSPGARSTQAWNEWPLLSKRMTSHVLVVRAVNVPASVQTRRDRS